MGLQMQNPQEYHETNHKWTFSTFDECWHCRKAKKVCLQKVRYKTRWDAWQEADSLNEDNGYERPLVPYRCRWCYEYHLTSTLDKFKAHRAERRRRAWLTAKEMRRRAGHSRTSGAGGSPSPG